MLLPDSPSFRRLMGCFATGVAVASTLGKDGKPVGLTINSLTSVSLAPPLVLFCLDRAAHVFPIFDGATHFAVSILSAAQEEISRSFADFRRHPQPPDLWEPEWRDAPVLRGTLGWMVCRKTATYAGGDHVILLGEVMELAAHPTAEPLAYFQGRYRRLGG